MLNLKQMFCSHDWFTVENMSAGNAVIEFINENKVPYSSGDVIYNTTYHSSRVLHDKVCLKCKLVKPELSNFRKHLKNMTEKDFNSARNTAKRMLSDAATQAQKYNARKIEAKIILTEYLNNI